MKKIDLSPIFNSMGKTINSHNKVFKLKHNKIYSADDSLKQQRNNVKTYFNTAINNTIYDK